MNLINTVKKYQKYPIVRGAALVLVVLLVVVIVKSGEQVIEITETTKPLVSVTTPATYAGQQSLSLVGNVRAFTEAEITSEVSGRVTAVNVNLGDSVAAGQVIAVLENASQRAAVLQAEGVYEAALAASAQNTVSVSQAEISLKSAQNSLTSTLKGAYNSTNGVVLTTIDDFYANPNNFVPGVKIDAKGMTSFLNSERVAYQTLLPTWGSRVNSLSNDSNFTVEVEYTKANILRTITLLDTFLDIFNQQTSSGRYSQSELKAFSLEFTNQKTALLGQISTIESANSALDSAVDGLEKAKLAAAGGVSSASDAQVKQALGSLRAAQANLAKTILRSPITGSVNSLTVRTGDFISGLDKVAIVANNSALEVMTYISDSERDLLNIGDKVFIEEVYEGTITQIAPAVDVNTRKTEVRIAVDGANIANGDTVRVSKIFESAEAEIDKVMAPLTAVKFEITDGFIFKVVDGKLEQHPVSIGVVRGNSVEIVAGLGYNDEFVVDSRGLLPGSLVEIAK